MDNIFIIELDDEVESVNFKKYIHPSDKLIKYVYIKM